MHASERPEFELLSRLREARHSGQIWALPWLIVLSEIVSRWGVTLLRPFYMGNLDNFDSVSLVIQKYQLVPIVFLLLALRLNPRALHLFLLSTIFALIFLEVWLSYWAHPAL